MVRILSRYPKPIAWFFITAFYVDLAITPVIANANTGRRNFLPAATSRPGAPAAQRMENLPVADNFMSPAASMDLAGGNEFRKTTAPEKVAEKFGGGPTQPEMQSFQSVNANNMVDLFTGDFSYNIPLLDVGGYPVNLHYQGGITMDQEASWVGLGWNINPGVITRNMRGLPDDFNGVDKVTKTVSMKDNRTLGVTVGGNAELIGKSQWTKIPKVPTDSVKGRGTTLGISLGVFHNTYKGWGTEIGLNAGINAGTGSKGPLSGGLSITNNSQEGLDVSPSFSFRLTKEDSKTRGDISVGTNFNSRMGIQNLQITGQMRQQFNSAKQQRFSFGSGINSVISFAKPSYTPTITIPFTSSQISFTAKVGSEHWAFHPNGYIRGFSSVQRIEAGDKKSVLPAYGYLYYEKSGQEQQVLLDFNREKDVSYQNNSPHIAVPIYTYDTYSITGEGTGGMFRPYRGEIGYVFDHAMSTKSTSNRLSIDLGFGSVVHAGLDFNTVYATTKNNPWLAQNALKDVIAFRGKDTTYENVFFKNPGEKTSVNKKFIEAVGDDNLIRVDLTGSGNMIVPTIQATRNISMFKNSRFIGRKTILPGTVRQERDKRTQAISFLTAEEAALVGLDKTIKSYDINAFPATTCLTNYRIIPRVDAGLPEIKIRKSHHLSEITVLNPDGRRYIYGLPVYNVSQDEVTMATDTGSKKNGLVSYTPNGDNTPNNTKGKDGYYNREELPSYAHSFLLTGIVSGDYTDITGDGITEDDNGEAVRFNYTRVYGTLDAYKWRAPYETNKAAYNEGLKTDDRDEKGSYTYGTRELWYLNSIESKTMIATFMLETDTVRKDGFGVIDENGGRNASQKLYRLKQINLYSKADYLKNGANAKPIKTVNFGYTYQLCSNNPGSESSTGKLTLQRVWFSYNKNNKGDRNPYVFTYNNNPSFNSKDVDRWGNYKDASNNPGLTNDELTNADYPYALQAGIKNWDSAQAAANAAPWTLTEIKLPSGGKLKVTYESDDYAYVQNKRAMQFFNIVGFGNSPAATPLNKLYESNKDATFDYDHVFIKVTEQAATREDVLRKYLEGVKQLYFKVLVKVPSDRWGKGHEYVPCYGDIVDYGVKGNPSDKMIWVRLRHVRASNEFPVAVAAVQFLRLNLPSKAYPHSEPGSNIGIGKIIGTLASAAHNVVSSIRGFDNHARTKGWMQEFDPVKSFVRLNNPVYKKLGGGLRVKKVEVYDNWNKMTGQQESVYGQEYDYSTIIKINGAPVRISSGVASYEPSIGNEENPFRVPHKVYTEKIGALAPTDFMYTEEPFGETFFPSPSVGYSKVRVQTIHKDKKSANGFQETEFYTAQEFPTIVEFTPLDKDSKKPYNPPIANVLKFDAKHFITLSQGFKIELNDMHGKMKSQASYSQNDPGTPISYTYNYFRLQNDYAGQKRLSNKVSVVDSASGVIDINGEIGKEVEVMIDVREQVSTTISGSLEANIDWAHPFPPVILGSGIPLPSKETNRYRAIAVMKIVNRYGIIDSILHIEKGSRVTTRNQLYDGETGEVLLSQTNNEFDDPVYNYSYPAHWAYSGMGPAYKNLGAVFTNVFFKVGKMYYANGVDTFPVSRFFESGDEIMVRGFETRWALTNDTCSPMFHLYLPFPIYLVNNKIWAINAEKGTEKHRGIYFIDKNGKPYSGRIQMAKIIRSGRRNLSSVAIGNIASLKSPVKFVNGKWRLSFDTTTQVITADAGQFRDFWRVDSSLYRKDTVIIMPIKVEMEKAYVFSDANYSLELAGRRGRSFRIFSNNDFFEASSYDLGTSNDYDSHKKSWMRFDFSELQSGMIIQSAFLNLTGNYRLPHLNERYSVSYPNASNKVYLQRTKGLWVADAIDQAKGIFARPQMQLQYFNEYGNGAVETATRVELDETPRNEPSTSPNKNIAVGPMVQNMVNDYFSSNRTYAPAIMMRLVDPTGQQGSDTLWSRRAFLSGISNKIRDYCFFKGFGSNDCPFIEINYFRPCSNGASPVYSATPEPGYYCYTEPKDTFVCRPNIDTIFNPYRFGVLGNWRMDRAYTYYDRRAQSDPDIATNIRIDGEIKSFQPYWTFTTSYLNAAADTNRWVWNSEMTLFNSKGMEIENKDPLDRYNSGQYGYNQSLPVAVAQNSKNRAMAFDGFEDYDYRTDTCNKCPLPRFIDLTNNGTRVDTISHTGKFSIRMAGNQTGSTQVQVVSLAQDAVTPKISLKIDSTAIVKTTVTGQGQGLKTEYLMNSRLPFNLNCGSISTNTWYTLADARNINGNWGTGSPPGVCPRDNYKMRWTGKIQPMYSEVYTFYVETDDYMIVTINGRRISQGRVMERPHDWKQIIPTDTITLQAGQLYNISVEYTELGGNSKFFLSWESTSQTRGIVPVDNLYLPTMVPADSAGSVHSDTTWCVRPQAPRPTRITHDRFSPLQGTKIVVTAWVKENAPCVSGSYLNSSLELQFNSGSPSLVDLRPKGPVIEGWQRIEDTLTIPASATTMTIRLRALSSTAVFFDDVRIHPFNANMKSYVYSPVNIRLMAELDENNYATFYEYDDDGTLIRLKKETERGIKTIRETRSVLIKNNN